MGGLLLDRVEVNIQGKLFYRSFLVPIYYHNSIYMSIAKKKIVGKSAIYFLVSFLLLVLLQICQRGSLGQKDNLPC